VLAQVGDGDARRRWGVVRGEGGDDLLVADPLELELVGQRVAGEQAERSVELVVARKRSMSAAMPSRRPTSTPG
jgi:hypothetical protein